MIRIFQQSADPPRGWLTLTLTFVFILVFRIEQNVAYVLGISSRQLVTVGTVPVDTAVHAFAPALHANASHLVSTLVWFVSFGYFLERRRPWGDCLGFVVLTGVLSTSLVPAVFVTSGISGGLGVGGSGITCALIGREATARTVAVVRRQSLSQVQGGILVVALLGMVRELLSLVSPPAQASVVGHGTGLVAGVVAGVGERDVVVDTHM